MNGSLRNLAVGLAAGVVATKITDYAQTALWRATPTKARAQERALGMPPSSEMAAAKLADACGVHLDTRTRSKAGQVVHYLTGALWALLYLGLRRRRFARFGAGCGTGLSLSLLIDELLVPRLGLSAPNYAYPAAAHVRGIATHLVYGLGVAAAAETLFAVLRSRRRRVRFTT